MHLNYAGGFIVLIFSTARNIFYRRDKQTGSFVVGRVFPNGPAFSLVNPGDVLESIDKTYLDGLRTQEVAALILGKLV